MPETSMLNDTKSGGMVEELNEFDNFALITSVADVSAERIANKRRLFHTKSPITVTLLNGLCPGRAADAGHCRVF